MLKDTALSSYINSPAPVDPAFIQRLKDAREHPAQISTSALPTPAPLPEPADASLHGWQERADQAETTLREAQAALDEANRQIAAARAARVQRQQKIAEFEQQAAQAAQESITAGHAEVSQAEQTADAEAERLRREVARADAALAKLQTQQNEAAQRVTQTQQAVAQAHADLERKRVEVEGEHVRTRTAELLAELRQIVADGRQYNQALVQAAQRQDQAYGRSLPDEIQVRRAWSHLLFLPGANPNVPEPVPNPGVQIRFAADLTSVEATEDLAQRSHLF